MKKFQSKIPQWINTTNLRPKKWNLVRTNKSSHIPFSSRNKEILWLSSICNRLNLQLLYKAPLWIINRLNKKTLNTRWPVRWCKVKSTNHGPKLYYSCLFQHALQLPLCKIFTQQDSRKYKRSIAPRVTAATNSKSTAVKTLYQLLNSSAKRKSNVYKLSQ
jgi:hypothetical protein